MSSGLDDLQLIVDYHRWRRIAGQQQAVGLPMEIRSHMGRIGYLVCGRHRRALSARLSRMDGEAECNRRRYRFLAIDFLFLVCHFEELGPRSKKSFRIADHQESAR